MRRSLKSANPFYALLVLFGIAFVITAAASYVFAVRAVRSHDDLNAPAAAHPLMTWMNAHGTTALATELGLLGLCTVGAIATDEFWQRRAARSPVNRDAQRGSASKAERGTTPRTPNESPI